MTCTSIDLNSNTKQFCIITPKVPCVVCASRTANMALFSLVLFSLAVNSALSARIAGYCALGGSEYLNTRQILEELASRGHEVE